MTATTSIDLEYQFQRRQESHEGPSLPDDDPQASHWYTVTLFDYSNASASIAIDKIRIYWNQPMLAGSSLTPRQFVTKFTNYGQHGGLTAEDAKLFGSWLEELLFPLQPSPGRQDGLSFRAMWNDALQMAHREHRPIQLQVSFPVDDQQGVAQTRGFLAELPLELLCRRNEPGFYFRRTGWSLVRAFTETSSSTLTVECDARIGLLWANTADADGNRLDESIFLGHERIIDDATTKFAFEALPPIRNVTLDRIRRLPQSDSSQGAGLVSIVAHGSAGRLLLHADPSDPKDMGHSVSAGEISDALRNAGMRIAFLWSCHGGRSQQEVGSVAETLLRQGDFSAVVGAAASLRATATVELAERLFEELATTSHGLLDRAVGAARRAIDEEDLQWAAPQYFARPERGQSVLFSRPAPMARQEGEWHVLGGPTLSPYFVGRDEQVRQGVELLEHHRLVTLTGLPGAGKTELAVAILQRMGEAPTRVVEQAVWISLAGMQSIDNLRSRLIAELELGKVEDDHDLVRAMRDRSLLIILDNAEDLIDSHRLPLQQLVALLLNGAPHVRLLMTSRRALGNPGSGVVERIERVDMLPAPHDRQAFVGAAGAALTEPDLQSPDLQNLIDLLAGHPRSLILVAGQLGYGMSLRAIRQRIEREDIDAVTVNEMVGVSVSSATDEQLRSRRLASSMNLAFDSLKRESPPAAEMFCWLGMLPSGIPSSLLESIFGERWEETLSIVLRHSMGIIGGPDRRVRLPAPIRWYAARRCQDIAPPRREDLWERTANALQSWFRYHYQHHLGTATSSIATRIAAEETANIDACIRSDANPSNPQAWRDAISGQVWYWARIQAYAGGASLALTQLNDWLKLLDETSTDGAMASIHESLGDLQVRTARLSQAEESYARALPIYREIEERLGEANTLKALGDLQVRTDRLSQAEENYARALTIYREIEERLGKANTLNSLGELERARGRPSVAFEFHRQALDQFIQIDGSLGQAAAIGYMARGAHAVAAFDRAAILSGMAWSRLVELEDRFGQSLVLTDLMQSLAALEEMEGANSALILLWNTRRSFDESGAKQWLDRLTHELPDFSPEQANEAWIASAEQTLRKQLQELSQRLESQGIDVFDPLNAVATMEGTTATEVSSETKASDDADSDDQDDDETGEGTTMAVGGH